jgi:hypothetical protein
VLVGCKEPAWACKYLSDVTTRERRWQHHCSGSWPSHPSSSAIGLSALQLPSNELKTAKSSHVDTHRMAVSQHEGGQVSDCHCDRGMRACVERAAPHVPQVTLMRASVPAARWSAFTCVPTQVYLRRRFVASSSIHARAVSAIGSYKCDIMMTDDEPPHAREVAHCQAKRVPLV